MHSCCLWQCFCSFLKILPFVKALFAVAMNLHTTHIHTNIFFCIFATIYFSHLLRIVSLIWLAGWISSTEYWAQWNPDWNKTMFPLPITYIFISWCVTDMVALFFTGLSPTPYQWNPCSKQTSAPCQSHFTWCMTKQGPCPGLGTLQPKANNCLFHILIWEISNPVFTIHFIWPFFNPHFWSLTQVKMVNRGNQ